MMKRRMPTFWKWGAMWLVLLIFAGMAGACGATGAPEASPAPTESLSLEPSSGEGSPVTAIRYSPDSQMLITGHDNGAVQVWDSSGAPQQALDAHDGPVRTVAVSPDDRFVASAGMDKRTFLQASDGSQTDELEKSLAWANTLDFSPDGTQLAVAFWEKLELWPMDNLEAGPTQIKELEPSISMAYWAPDGESIMVAMSNTGLAQPAILRVDPRDSSVVQTVHPTAAAQAAIFSPDGQRMATASDEDVQVWGIDGDSALQTLAVTNAVALAFNEDGSVLAVAAHDHQNKLVVTFWGVANGESQRSVGTDISGEVVAAFAPDVNALAVGLSDGRVEIVDLGE